MIKTFTSALALLGLVALPVSADDYKGSVPADGQTYYLYNVGRKQFLSAADGQMTLGSAQTAVTLGASDANHPGYYWLTAAGQRLGSTFHAGVQADGEAQYDEWRFEEVEGKSGVYTLAGRCREANADQYLLFDGKLALLTLESMQPGSYADAQWQLVKTDEIGENYVLIDENSETYTASTATDATVHLKHTFTLNKWNAVCLPFAVTAAQFYAQFGDDARLAEFTAREGSAVYFTSVSTPAMEAGKPYFIYPTKAATTEDDGTYYTFTNVPSFEETATDVTYEGTTFRGTYAKISISGNDKRYLFYDKLYGLYGGSTKIKGCGAYFTSDESTAALTEWKLDQPTGINTVTVDAAPTDVYDTNGRRVKTQTRDLDGLSEGVYVVKGKKIAK